MWFFAISLFFAWSDEMPKEKSAFEQALEQNVGYRTEERWMTIRGVRYREVKYEGKSHYLKFLSPELNSVEMECNFKSNDFSTRLVEGGVTVHKRTRLFIELLTTSCDEKNGQKKVVLNLDPRIGFTLPETEKSYIKNKKVFVGPGTGLGFSGEIP